MLVWFRGKGIGVGLGIRCVWIEHVSMKGRGLFWLERDTKINGRVYVVQHVKDGISVALRGFVVVRREEGVGGCKIWLVTAC